MGSINWYVASFQGVFQTLCGDFWNYHFLGKYGGPNFNFFLKMENFDLWTLIFAQKIKISKIPTWCLGNTLEGCSIPIYSASSTIEIHILDILCENWAFFGDTVISYTISAQKFMVPWKWHLFSAKKCWHKCWHLQNNDIMVKFIMYFEISASIYTRFIRSRIPAFY